MTKKEFIRRLKKARKLALTDYKSEWRIFEACHRCGIAWMGLDANADISDSTTAYLITHGNTEANVRAVFDNSIRALGGKP